MATKTATRMITTTPTNTPSEGESYRQLGWQSAYDTAEKRLQEVEREGRRLRYAMRMIRRQIKENAPFPGENTFIGQGEG